MLQKDIEEVLITEEEIQEKVAELGAVLQRITRINSRLQSVF